jgi:adenylate cyclase
VAKQKTKKRAPLLAAMAAATGIATLAIALILFDPFPVRALRDLVFDSYQRFSPRAYDPATPVRVVAIDEPSLARLGQWPWARETLATIIDNLAQAKAAAISLDVLFAEYERSPGYERNPSDSSAPARTSPGDEKLAAAMAKASVVIGQALSDQGPSPVVKPGFAYAGDNPLVFAPRYGGSIRPLPEFIAVAKGVGALNWVPDRDLVVRRVPTLFAVDGKLVPTFAIETLRVAQDASSLLVKASNASGETGFGAETGITALRIGAITAATDRDGSLRVRYAGTHPQRRISAIDIYDGKFDVAAVEGSIILIGATAAALSDIRATPLEGAVPGIDIHAEVIEHLLTGASLTRPDWAPGAEALAVLAGCLAAAFAAVRFSPLFGASIMLFMVEAVIGGSMMLFLKQDRLLDPTMPTLATGLAYAVAAVGALRRSQREGREIRDAFGRYVSPDVVAALGTDPSKLALGGQMRDITVLFSDVRGFTARSETLSAEEVVSFLNAIHTPMTEEVLSSGGTLDKFIGDGLMAFWNAPLETRDHVRKSLRCAMAMQKALGPVDAEMASSSNMAGQDHKPLAIGIGIHTGQACVGNLGSIRRFDYSAVGDTVNMAARIEQSSKTYGVPIIVSQAMTEAAPDFAYFVIDSEKLRGRSSETQLFALHGGPEAITPEFISFRDCHEAAFAAVQCHAPTALELISRCELDPIGQNFPKLYAIYRARVLDGGEHKP